jgi:hypothetical protein
VTGAEGGVPPGAVWTIVGAGALGLVATYWDDGWHTEIGRDSALIPPHLLLYVSVGLVGVVLAGWVLTTLWRTRSIRAVLATPGLALAAAAGLVTAGAAPADAAWHAAFGRDSVLWSPPHLLSVIGTAVLVVAVLLGATGSRHARTALAVLLLGAAEIVVLEYETDVPQFAEALYLPVLLAVALGVAWVVRTLVADSAVVAWTVLGYLVFRLGILVAFAVSGWVVPDVPVALLGLLVLEAPARWGRMRWPLAGLAIVVLQVVASAAGISAVATGPTLVAAAIVAPVLAVVLIAVTNRRLVPGAAVLALFLALFLATSALAPPARAHDPGQGEELATARLTVSGDGAGGVSVRVDDLDDARGREWTAGALVARRAGQVVVAPLAGRRTAFDGAIELPSSGLWFVYAELRTGGTTAEVWLPVRQDEPGTLIARRPVYLPAGVGERPVGEFLAGTALLVVGAGLVGWSGAAVRRRRSAVRTETA